MAFVIDASVTMAWCFEDEATDAADEVLGRLVLEGVVVPAVWPLEVANVLVVAERRRRLSEAQATRFTKLLGELPIEVDLTRLRIGDVAALARKHGLSSHDASYLMLAEQRGLPLATLDERLAAAAAAAGVAVL